ncbi:MAG: peptide ABC transporter substrate-binding protein [Roseiflexaceae bacterium]|nr:peptide ABC transporter substrate-binding protein [Roseiflexaceae bacterium]
MRTTLFMLLMLALVACATPNATPTAVPQIPISATPNAKPTTKPAPTKTYPPTFPTATLRPESKASAGRYTNPENGIILNYPSNWETANGERDGDLAWFYPTERDVFTLLYVNTNPTNQSLEESARAAHANGLNGLNDIQLISEKSDHLNDGKATWVSEYQANRAGETLQFVMTSALHGRQLITIFQYGVPEAIDQRRTELTQLVQSLKLSSPLRYGIPEDQALLDLGGESDNPRSYDPAHAGGGRLIYSGLVSFTPAMQLAPDLAESWDVSADGTVYTFHLHPNARFHNGRPVTADDVIYSWDRAADPQTDSNSVLTYLGDIVGLAERHAGTATNISGLRAIDQHTLEVRIDAAKPYFVMKLTYLTAFVVDHANIATGPEWYRTPNGTGPYQLIRWDAGKVRIYQRFQAFYGDLPKIPYVIEQLYAGAALRLYETGDLDWTGIGGFALDRARDPKGPWYGQLREATSMCTNYIGLDSHQPPFDDLKVRQAFSQAIDRSRLAELAQGNVIPAQGLYPPALPGYRADLRGQQFDPQTARKLLAESRYGGQALPPIIFTSSGYGSDISGNQAALAQMWQQHLGVTIRFENLEPSRWEESMHAGRHGQLFSYGWCADYPDPENFADALFHSGAQQNLGGYSNAALDTLLERARIEPNITQRLVLYQQAEQMIVDDTAAIFLDHTRNFVLIQPRIAGYVLTPIGVPIERYLSIQQVP